MNGDSNPMPGNSPEPGAEDNLLHLNPADERWKDTVGEWKDGQKYTFQNVEVEQISSGEFRVLSAEPGPAESETPAEDASTGEESYTSAYPANPAIAKMMAGPKR